MSQDFIQETFIAVYQYQQGWEGQWLAKDGGIYSDGKFYPTPEAAIKSARQLVKVQGALTVLFKMLDEWSLRGLLSQEEVLNLETSLHW